MYNKQTRPRYGEASSLFFDIFPQFLSKSRNFMWKYKASFAFFTTFTRIDKISIKISDKLTKIFQQIKQN